LDNNNQILTVSELTKEIKLSLESNFSKVSIIGEISNFKQHISGHWYFNLKDAEAVINCTMWKGFNQYVFFTPQNGMKVILNGKITVYLPRGNYQIDARSMKPAGLGELQEAFERLKQKLEAEGLFDEEHKREISSFPKKIGIVTAIDGAALRDMISVANRRYPLLEIVIAPATVQGSGAAESIVNCIMRLNKEKDIDTIIVARGGGSIEDFWGFNEPIVARAIYSSKIPVISGVGHETDFTISDYVADLRAPTPSVAMELATPDRREIIAFISDFSYYLKNNLVNIIHNSRSRIRQVISSYGFRVPIDLVRRKQQEVDFIISTILQIIDRKILVNNQNVTLLVKTIESYDIKKTLKRGFVLVEQNSKFVKMLADLNKNQPADLSFYDGKIKVHT
jgi:exodeoxyribonuclease VII large subunit